MKTLEQKIEVMQAALDGKSIQHRFSESEEWTQLSPGWDWIESDYRIKPEPIEIWIVFNLQDDFVGSHFSSGNAENTLRQIGSGRIVKCREVIE